MRIDMTHSRTSGWLVVALLTIGVLIGGCGDTDAPGASPREQGPRDPIPVSLEPVRTGPLERSIEVVGTLYGDEEATISAKVPGRIETVFADIGDRVGEGQALAQIDPTDYELVISQREYAMREALSELGLSELPGEEFNVRTVATVERARAEAENAKAKLERGRQLFEQTPPLLSEQDFQDLQTAYDVAQQNFEVAVLEAQARLAQARTRSSERDAARQRLADTTVRAPISGSTRTASASESAVPTENDRFAVAQRLVSAGEYVREGDPLFRLVADQPLKLRAAVPERFISAIQTGQAVRVRVEGYDEQFAGQVSRVNPAIDTATRTFQIEAIIPNEPRQLRAGAFARAQVIVGEDPAVTFVPRRAVVSFAGIDRVFTVDADSKAVEHEVRLRTDYTQPDEVALVEALPADAQVVTVGNNRLAGGDPVQVGPAPTTGPATQP